MTIISKKKSILYFFLQSFSFVTVNIAYPELYVEVHENLPGTNTSKPVWMLCKDLRHRCQYVQMEYDVSIYCRFRCDEIHSNPKLNMIRFASIIPNDIQNQFFLSRFCLQNFSRRPMTANIPIGNANMSFTVTIFTISLSWLACIYLIFVIRKKYFAIRHKLEPNQILNQKQK